MIVGLYTEQATILCRTLRESRDITIRPHAIIICNMRLHIGDDKKVQLVFYTTVHCVMMGK